MASRSTGGFGGLIVTVRALLAASHPLPTAAVTAFVAVVAVAAGRSPADCVLVALAVLTGQLSIGWCNDAVDAPRDVALGRTDKPIVTGAAPRRLVAGAAVLAFAACVPLSLATGVPAGTVHLVGVLAGWTYDAGVKRTVLSFVPYAVGFGALPAFVTLGLPGAPWPAAWGVAAAALLGVGAHLANAVPDIDGDLRTGIRGLPQRLGERTTRLVLPAPMLTASVVLVLGPPGRPALLAWPALAACAALSVTAALAPRRYSFRAAIGAAAVAVVLFAVNASALS
ncbi:MAG: hypothetical protein GEV10_17040 [Streptosporangiales bacterium]|nr:hypothetical protein [Streptosporangiales bacterium]